MDEHYYSIDFSENIKKITSKKVSTMCKRVELLSASDYIIEFVKSNRISFSEALILKKVAKNNNDLVDRAIVYIELEEKKSKRPSVILFEKWLKNESGYINKNRGNDKDKTYSYKSNSSSCININFNNCTINIIKKF